MNFRAGLVKEELTRSQWKTIFQEAVQISVNFNLLSGGGPFSRKDILEAASEVKEMIFPVFTNGIVMSEYLLR